MTQGTFRNTASDIFAGNNIDISANKVEISDGVHQSLNNFSSVSLNFSAPSTISLDYQSTDYTVTTHRSSNFLAGNNLAIHSNTNLDITGSNLATSNILSLSGQNITIQNGLYTDTVNTTGGGLFLNRTFSSATIGGYAFASNSSFETSTPTTLFAKDILINASDTTNIKASILGAQDSLTINTNNLLISGEYQRSKSDTVNGSVSLTFVPPTNVSVGVSGGYEYSREGTYQEAILNAPNLTLNTGNQSIYGANINGVDINPHSDYSEQHSYSASLGIGTAGISGGIGYDDFSAFGGVGPQGGYVGGGYGDFIGGLNFGTPTGSTGATQGVFVGYTEYGTVGLTHGTTNGSSSHDFFSSNFNILGINGSASFQEGNYVGSAINIGNHNVFTDINQPFNYTCFKGWVKVKTIDSEQRIDTLKVGDKILSYDEKN
jgi:hypothetical protein